MPRSLIWPLGAPADLYALPQKQHLQGMRFFAMRSHLRADATQLNLSCVLNSSDRAPPCALGMWASVGSCEIARCLTMSLCTSAGKRDTRVHALSWIQEEVEAHHVMQALLPVL